MDDEKKNVSVGAKDLGVTSKHSSISQNVGRGFEQAAASMKHQSRQVNQNQPGTVDSQDLLIGSGEPVVPKKSLFRRIFRK